MKGIKGFKKGLICEGDGYEKQYAENTEFSEEVKPKCCNKGMHIVMDPLDVFNYYPPSGSEYAEVEALGDIDRESNGDSKISTNRLKIGLKIDLKGVIKAGLDFIFEKTKASKETVNTTGAEAHAATTGAEAHAATTGVRAHAATTGVRAHAATTGAEAHAATTGKNSISAALGKESKAKAALNSWIVLSEWVWDREWKLKDVKTAQVDGEKIKADTYYQLKGGEFVEVSEDD